MSCATIVDELDQVDLFLLEYGKYLESSQIDLIKFHQKHFKDFNFHSHIENEKFGKKAEVIRIVTFAYGNQKAQGQLIIKFKV